MQTKFIKLFTNSIHYGGFDAPGSPVVASEFVGTSVTAHGPSYDTFAKVLPDNPHVHFFDSRVHGYVTFDIAPSETKTRFRAVSDATDPKATVSTLKSFAVENGKPGVLTD
jgi:alkaline phosphatase D